MNYIYILSFLILFTGTVLSERGLSLTNYTMDFFKELSPVTCRKNEDCPDYSNGCYVPHIGYGVCNIYMFCHETDFCLKLSLGEFDYEEYYRWPYYKTESYDIHNLTMNSCNLKIKEKLKENTTMDVDKLGSITDAKGNDNDNWGIFEDCKYLKCSDSKCFSGKCNKENDLCEINELKTGYVCTINYKREKNEFSVVCLLMNHEPCSSNNECLSDVCDTQAKICVSVNSELSFQEKISLFLKNKWYYILAGFIAILVMIGIVSRIIRRIRKPKEVVLAKMNY